MNLLKIRYYNLDFGNFNLEQYYYKFNKIWKN